MAFKAVQITATGSTPVALIVAGDGTGTTFKNAQGSVQNPLPISFLVTGGTTYWGGPTVSNTTGQILIANSPIIMNVYADDLPYVWSAGSNTVYVVVGQQ